jgi:stage V sporulation protein D (sporulation-specific penicillin-binding protein)
MVTKKSSQTMFDFRSSLLTAFLLLIFAVIVVKLFNLQVVRGSEFRQEADAQHDIYQKLLPSRGEIELVDQSTLQTIPLATNAKSYLVYAIPQDIVSPNLTADSLSTVLGLDSGVILSKITNKNEKYVPLKENLTNEEQQEITNLGLPGIYFDSQDTRVYPENNLLSQTLGFVGYDAKGTQKVGLYGLESYFQKDLAGVPGSLDAEIDSSGNWIYGTEAMTSQLKMAPISF